ncbi:hypothetical protein ACFVXE_05855 [Streptomyces sp. NPDC058231]|uniref:hypothetical protein n=1 Tax=Streptomyces sp. NPDC058231 TaxID=3346392 RepID=UPI0036F1472A
MRHIVAQSCLLKADLDGKVRMHIPDRLLLTDDGNCRDWLLDSDLVAALRAADLDGMALDDAFALLPGCARLLLKSAVLHLLWYRQVTTASDRPLSAGHMLRRASR